MIKAAIFDIGGVLLHWTNLPMFEDIDQTLQVTETQRHEAWNKHIPLLEIGKITEEEFWKGFTKDIQTKEELPQESLLQREFKKRFSINTDTLDLAHNLKLTGLKLGIISNTIEPHSQVLRESSLFDQFDVVVLSNEVGLRKPEKEIYHMTLDRLAIKPNEAFFVDDLSENVEGAKKIGMHAILFKNIEELRNEIRLLGVEV